MKSTSAPGDLDRDRPRPDEVDFWDWQLRARIGQDLRSIFETSVNEPLPERLSNLVHQIDEVGRDDSSSTGPQPDQGKEGV